jgi:hypothetical protein
MKILRLYLLPLSLFCCVLPALLAQQESLISFYRHNWSQIIPAAFPREHAELVEVNWFFNINARSQRQRVAVGAPRHIAVRAEYILPSKNTKSKFGLDLTKDEAGAIAQTKARFTYAWLAQIDYVGALAFGGSVAYNNQSIQTDKVNWQNPSVIPLLVRRDFVDFSAGVFYYSYLPNSGSGAFTRKIQQQPSEEFWYIGASISHAPFLTIGHIAYATPHTQWNLIGGGTINYGKGRGRSGIHKRLEPSVWLRWLPNISYQTIGNFPVSMDFSLRHVFKWWSKKQSNWAGNEWWFGATANTAATAGFELGFRGWLSVGDFRFSPSHYIQVSLAYNRFRLSPKAIPQVNDVALNLAFNLAKKPK